MMQVSKKEEDLFEWSTSTKFTRYPKLYFNITRFIELFRVACHRPYMIKAILSTRCPQCGRWLSFPTIQGQRTMYQNRYANYFCGCKYCHEENDRYWDDMWLVKLVNEGDSIFDFLRKIGDRA